MFYLRVFSIGIHRNCKTKLLLAICPDLEITQIWSVDYICQICKLNSYFGDVRNFKQYLYR